MESKRVEHVSCCERAFARPIGYAAPPDQSTASASGPEQTHQLEFHGRAGEFFRIWIVNVVLTVCTLGIYAAWAKVRTLRYFYGNTRLDDKPFDFAGNPISTHSECPPFSRAQHRASQCAL